jgi:hypothetical protein
MLNRLDELLPELAKFCRLLEKNVDEEFVMNQLLRLGSIYDYSDEAGRRALSALLRTCSFPLLSYFILQRSLLTSSARHQGTCSFKENLSPSWNPP